MTGAPTLLFTFGSQVLNYVNKCSAIIVYKITDTMNKNREHKAILYIQ